MIHIPGLYRHSKGGLYETMAIAKETETNIDYVVYRSVRSDIVWCRPLSMWTEKVKWPDGVMRDRFVLERIPQPAEAQDLGLLFSTQQRQEESGTSVTPRATSGG